jgi:hypothetical protein
MGKRTRKKRAIQKKNTRYAHFIKVRNHTTHSPRNIRMKARTISPRAENNR